MKWLFAIVLKKALMRAPVGPELEQAVYVSVALAANAEEL